MTRLATIIVLSATVAVGVAGLTRADTNHSSVMRGRYLVAAGDCYGCHTADPAKPFAGGRALQTPFGAVYSANITPDRRTGIGAWTDDQFYRALHEGISANGDRLYPAFPYPYYTHVTRDDVQAIRDYLSSLGPIGNEPPRNTLPFPLNARAMLRPWNWMFFDDGTFRPDKAKSAEWNRGAYLVEGLGHCGACHTPKNVVGADEHDKALRGARLADWFAPNLGDDLRTGLGAWNVEDITEYLRTGRNRHDNATGPMAEVIRNSTSQLAPDDIHAIATYLKDLPAGTAKPADDSTGTTVRPEIASAGQAVFVDQCSACHRAGGDGVPAMFPPLKGNANVQQADPTTVIRVILEGARSEPTARRPTPASMPAFDWKLGDAQIAAVASYVRNTWGNAAPPVTADAVRDLRRTIRGKPD